MYTHARPTSPSPNFFIYSQEHPTGGRAVFRPPRNTTTTIHLSTSLNHILNPKLKLGRIVGRRWRTAATVADYNDDGRAVTSIGGYGWWLWAAFPCCFISIGGCSMRDQDEAASMMVFGGGGLRKDGGVWWGWVVRWVLLTTTAVLGGEVGFANGGW
ncbi:unnamed protein product [Lactuca saligna]|uniref:Uncharacterized protein n=1 Tax=Lactuca saligna TaxID=75948 RepID=A0AA35ZBP0_LACSI|nr:unnamed protein product [Lactuca saligna]